MKNKPFLLLMIVFLIASSFQIQPRAAAGQTPVELAGTFLVVWGDGSPANPATATRYFLAQESGEQLELIFSPLVVTGSNLLALNRQPVLVQGSWLETPGGDGGVLSVDQVQRDLSRQAEPDGVFGHQPWVSIMCKFSDYTVEPKDLAYFQNMYSASYPGLDHYWREQSFDQVDLIGSGAFGWFVLPNPRSYYVPPSGYMDWGLAAQDCTAAADSVVDFTPYVGINLMFNADLDGYAWGGSWYLCLDGLCQNWRMTWEPPWGYSNIGVIAHETGHGFGLPHSSGDYGQVYDNAWDVMSDLWSNGNRGGIDPVYGTMGQHTIAFHKNLLEWIDSDHMVEVHRGEQVTLTIERIALPQTNEALGAKVLINNSPSLYYTVESRRFAGYDSYLPGEAVIIHEVDVSRSEPAHVVDIDNNGNTGDEGAMWRVGETFEDAANGIRVTVVSATATGFVVTIGNYIPLSSVAVSGPVEGLTDEEYTFSASVLPINASEPITYVWEATGQLPVTHTNGVDDMVAFTWIDGGTKTITVTASNPSNVVADTHMININPLTAPESVAISGPLIGGVGIEQVYNASVLPLNATEPITYVWQASGQETLTQTNGIEDAAYFTWTEPGTHTITVTASNEGGVVSDTYTVDILIMPVESVSISGPLTGVVGLEQSYLASVLPLTATLPVTYVWQASGQETLTRTGGLTDTVTYTWQAPGEQVINLLALNALGAVTTTFNTVVLTPELEVVISGTTGGYSGLEYFLTAQVSPLTATQPLTYVWTIGALDSVTHTGGLTDTLFFILDTPGTYLITLQVSNAYVSASATWDVVITGRLFIPLVGK